MRVKKHNFLMLFDACEVDAMPVVKSIHFVDEQLYIFFNTAKVSV